MWLLFNIREAFFFLIIAPLGLPWWAYILCAVGSIVIQCFADLLLDCIMIPLAIYGFILVLQCPTWILVLYIILLVLWIVWWLLVTIPTFCKNYIDRKCGRL